MDYPIFDPPLKVYSPSSAALWRQCGIKYHLDRDERLVYKYSRTIGSKLSGSGFAAGVEVLHRSWMGEGTAKFIEGEALQKAMEAAILCITTEGAAYRSAGVGITPGDHIPLVCATLEKYAQARPLLGYTIYEVEHTFPEEGNCRIDLGAEKGGDFYVIDVKYKNTLDSKYKSRTLQRYLRSWQFYHYAWAYEKRCTQLGRVSPNTPVWVGLLLVVAKPFSVQLVIDHLPRDWQQVWLEGAQQVWRDMYAEEQDKRATTLAADHEDQYGPCEYQGVCFDHLLDIDQALRGDYVRVARGPTKVVTV